jgi:KDO2-lipid IV(A) lauroyltransferase
MSLPQPVRRWRRWGFYALLRLFAGTLRRMPRPFGRAALRGLGRLAWMVLGAERALARENLRRALPELTESRRERLARASMLRLGENLLDMARGGVRVEFDAGHRARLTELLESGPVLCLMAHCGAWELVGPELVQCSGGRFGAVVASPHNRWVGEWLRREREFRGIRCFDRDQEVAAAAKWLSRGGCLAVLADHRPRGARVLAPWFGYDAPTTTGPARLAAVAGATIVPLGIRRENDGHRIGLGTPFVPTGDVGRDAVRCNEALQELILRSPEEWTWFHDRYDESPAP